MTDIGTLPTSNYISDGELIAWLEEKSEAQYGELRNLINVSTERGEIMKDLSTLKASVDSGRSPEDLATDMQAIRDKYSESPYAAELEELLGPLQSQLESVDNPSDIAKDLEKAEKKANDTTLSWSDRKEAKDEAAQLKQEQEFLKNFRSGYGDKIQAEVDQLGRIDSLELIKIQDVMADARQTSQLGSSILASSDQASAAILGNIRG